MVKRTTCNKFKYWIFSAWSFGTTKKTSNVFRQEGLAYEVLQWYICRMEAWFAADADMISLKSWDQASGLLIF
jgi:hypothetical protein